MKDYSESLEEISVTYKAFSNQVEYMQEEIEAHKQKLKEKGVEPTLMTEFYETTMDTLYFLLHEVKEIRTTLLDKEHDTR